MNDTKRDIDGLIAALGHQKQCDEEGVLIAVSRQAVDEAMAALRELTAERERADRAKAEGVKEGMRRAAEIAEEHASVEGIAQRIRAAILKEAGE